MSVQHANCDDVFGSAEEGAGCTGSSSRVPMGTTSMPMGTTSVPVGAPFAVVLRAAQTQHQEALRMLDDILEYAQRHTANVRSGTELLQAQAAQRQACSAALGSLRLDLAAYTDDASAVISSDEKEILEDEMFQLNYEQDVVLCDALLTSWLDYRIAGSVDTDAAND